MPERMAVAKAVLNKASYNDLLDYFLSAFEKQFADEIAIRKSIISKPEREIVLDRPAEAEHLL
jgi:hypothetical protein